MPADPASRKVEPLPMPLPLEDRVRAFWKERGIFAKSLQKDGPPFVFYEGPPTANGMPHNGHVLTRVVKDLFPRYRTMRGFKVDRKAGWDTHGLPVEVEVEKLLGIHGKEAIEAYGVEPFAQRCIESVFVYTKEWEEMTERVGFWVDLDTAYVTYHRSYVESVWWALSELFKKGLLYRDYKVVWWWAQGGTALSSGEVGEGYQTVDDPSVTLRFPVTEDPNGVVPPGYAGRVSLLAWTTTPWTLPSHVALAVHRDLDYCFVRVEREGAEPELVVVAEGLREQVTGEVVATVKGAALLGLRYEPPFRYAEPTGGRAFLVVHGDHVTLGAGTGIVHTAPAFGEDDFALRRAEGLGFLQLVGPDGRFIEGTGALAGRFCKECDKDITADLKHRGLLFSHTTYRHDYPFCPRSPSDPLIQYARPAWFIRTTALKAEALANNAQVNWLPETIKEGRFGDFLRNNVDWALSRERFWGTPLNIWTCRSCERQAAPASVAEIEALGGVLAEGIAPDLAVHKPWIDRVTLRCPHCGGEMARVPEVIDCWFDSGCMPFAQWGWPHQNQAAFAQAFPADFISEAVDQTRGWFYSLLMISTLLFDEETCARFGLAPRPYPRPYRTCIVLGHVCDADGKKESKSKGNYTSPDLVLKGWMKVGVKADPRVKPGQVAMKPPQVKSLGCAPGERLTAADGSQFEVVPLSVSGKDVVAMHPDDAARLGPSTTLTPPFPPPGADAFRWLFYASGPPWSNTRISLKAILEGQREFLFRLKNVHQFYALNSEGHTPARPRAAHLLDRWILHELAVLERDVTGWLDAFLVYEPARALQGFVDLLSNWWLRRSRDRFDDAGADGQDARDTLRFVLLELSALCAPFVPFMAEAMWQSLRTDDMAESVHLADWPSFDPDHLDEDLGRRMSLARDIASLGLAARAGVGVRVRQPLQAAEVVLAHPGEAAGLAELVPLVQEELNVREVRFSADAGRFVKFVVKPDFKVLGAKLGKDMKACAAALAGMEGGAVRAAVLGGGLGLELPGGTVVLGPGDIAVQVQPLPGYQAAGDAEAVVALEATLTEDLLEEGLSRELAAKIASVRKGLGLAYDQRIRVAVTGGARAARAWERFGGAVCAATLAESAPWGSLTGEEVEVAVDGETVRLVVAVGV